MKSATEPQRIAVPNDDLWPLLIEFALNLRGWWAEVCDGLDLTPTQGLALRTLDPDSPLAMSALADTLACDASNITGVVDKLEARGLIARQGAEYDRRVKVLVVTEKGRELRRKLFARAAQPPAALARLPAKARDQMTELLRALIAERSARADVGSAKSSG
jgi:DNA-binding MarR family transcriptional regulator